MRRLPSSVGVAVVWCLLAVTDLAGQARTCDLIDSQQVNSVTQGGGRVSHVTRPRFLCTDGTRIEADSSVTFESNSFTQLFGSVLFRDGPQELLADRAQYFSGAGRIQAQGAVKLTDLDDGSSITGETMIMLQSGDDRPEDDMTMRGGRPHARFLSKAVPVADTIPMPDAEVDSLAVTIAPPDSTVPAPDSTAPPSDAPPDTLAVESIEPDPPAPPTPFEVDADVIRLVGDRLFQARGHVEMRQDSLLAFGDSMNYMEDLGLLTLFGDARLLSPNEESGDTLDVRGDTIDMRLPNNRIDQIEARGHAHLVTETVDIRGPVVRIFFSRDAPSRIVSVLGEASRKLPDPPAAQKPADSLTVLPPDPFARPQTTAEDFRLTGDSIEVKTPGGHLESVVASGRAHGVSSGRDSINTADTPEFIRNDWIEGETITATFADTKNDSTAAESVADTEDDSTAAEPVATPPKEGRSSYRLDLLVARGGARSFYRSAPKSTSDSVSGVRPLELNYVLGDEIRLFMKDGEVNRMEVDKAKGAYFQPATGPKLPPPDTVPLTPPDTTGAPRVPGNPREPQR